MTINDPKDVVRRGYDPVSRHYRGDDAQEGQYGPWITRLQQRVRSAATILDLGCGCGVPVAHALDKAGHAVTGVDLSEVQLHRARALVSHATFIHADATVVDFPPASFDAIVCLYALIHMPLTEQPGLLTRIATWLRPGGWLLATTGQQTWTGTDEDWLGSGTPMWWSHTDATTYRSWIAQAGLTVETETFVPEGTSGHALFWAHRP